MERPRGRHETVALRNVVTRSTPIERGSEISDEPTADAEASMGEQRIRKIILEIVAAVAPDADLSNVRDDLRLRDQLDLDSMDFLDIVMELRKRFKIEVPKEEYPMLATLESCVKYLLPKFEAVVAVH